MTDRRKYTSNFRGFYIVRSIVFPIIGVIHKDQDYMALLTLASVPLTFMVLLEPVMVEEAVAELTPQ